MIVIWALISYTFMWYFSLPWGAFFTLWACFLLTNVYSAYKASMETSQEIFKLFR